MNERFYLVTIPLLLIDLAIKAKLRHLLIDHNLLLMQRRILRLALLLGIIFFNPLFFTKAWADSDTFLWIGGFSDRWEDGANWMNLDSMTVGLLPLPVDDVMIDGNVTVTVNSNLVIESVQLSGGATLIIVAGAGLSTTEGGLNGSNSFRLDVSSPNEDYPDDIDGSNSGPSELIVYGTLNLNNDDARGSGLYISTGTSVTIENTGSLYITNDGDSDEAIRVKGGYLTNNGTIAITNPGPAGINSSSGSNQYRIVNNGMFTITGGVIGLNIGSTWMENNGTVLITGTSDKMIAGDGNFKNKGTFGGNGTVEADIDFILESGSILAPGASPGILILDNGSETINLNGVTLQMEVDGPGAGSGYDQIQITGSGNLNLNGSTLNLAGTYTPVVDDQFFLAISNGIGNITGTFGGGPFQLNSVPLTDISGGGLEFGAVFPVELTSFTARSAGKAVQLNWATVTETNNDYFAIEHSTDGRSFSKIGRVTGSGTTLEEHRYVFVHHSPENGLNYYRLHQHDFDGASEYSPVQTVVMEGKNTWTAWPTIAHDVINLEWTEAPKGNVAVEVFNLSGQKVYGGETPGQSATAPIPVGHLAPGIYWVVVQSNREVSSQRFVKQ